MSIEQPGGAFLHQKDSKLHTSKYVEHEQERRKRTGEQTSSKPADKINDFMEVLEKIHLGHRDDEKILDRIKDYYHKEYVIKENDVPESYFDNQRRILREQGHGNVNFTKKERGDSIEVLQNDQRSTLDNWINYFTSTDSDSFPMWAKYWAFNGMTKLSTYDKEKHKFNIRDKGTVAPFVDLNREALAYTIDSIIKKAKGENIALEQEDPEFKKLLNGANFGKLYAYAIEKVTPAKENELENTKGEWIKYNKGSDHMPLVKSLQGHGTGWCTAGENTAQKHLQGGDFYVYYSYDENKKPTIPRVAIRMKGHQINEVRGIAKDQNLDPYINDVVTEKLNEFPDGELYQKKVEDMKRLTEIDNKSKSGQELNKDDLRFLYEIDSEIKGFGYEKDPRIQEILQERDIKEDMSIAIDCKKEEISLTKEEALSGNIKYHYGDLYLRNLTSAQGLELPEIIRGSLYLYSLTSADGLKFPKSVGGYLDLYNLTSARGLELPKIIRGYLDLRSLTSADGLKFPKSVGGDLSLYNLTSADGLKLPESVGRSLDLRNLTSADGLKLPENIGGDLYLSSLTSADGLKFPKSVGGDLGLDSLTSADGLKLPESVGGGLGLSNLTSADGLKLPKYIGGHLSLPNLTSAQGLELPQNVGGYIYLPGLTSADGLKFPESVGGDLYLYNLTSADGLKLPEIIRGNLDLRGLTSAQGLELPENIGGYIYLPGLTSVEKDELRQKYPKLKII